MVDVYVGIGSNLGDRYGNCAEAVRKISEMRGVDAVAASSFYETDPVGGPSQGPYVNGVLRVRTDTEPAEFLRGLKAIEREMGRPDVSERNSPRTIDLDILLYGDIAVHTDELVIPHPRMHQRYFVLKGLSEISPRIVHPGTGKTAEELFRETDVVCSSEKRQRLENGSS